MSAALALVGLALWVLATATLVERVVSRVMALADARLDAVRAAAAEHEGRGTAELQLVDARAEVASLRQARIVDAATHDAREVQLAGELAQLRTALAKIESPADRSDRDGAA